MQSIDTILLDSSKIVKHNSFSLQCVAEEEEVFGNNTCACITNLQLTTTIIIYRWFYDFKFLMFITFPMFLKFQNLLSSIRLPGKYFGCRFTVNVEKIFQLYTSSKISKLQWATRLVETLIGNDTFRYLRVNVNKDQNKSLTQLKIQFLSYFVHWEALVPYI